MYPPKTEACGQALVHTSGLTTQTALTMSLRQGSACLLLPSVLVFSRASSEQNRNRAMLGSEAIAGAVCVHRGKESETDQGACFTRSRAPFRAESCSQH